MAKENISKNEIVKKVDLDERKAMILFIIIKIYLETGEPVGSRTISKKLPINLSSATIRNEMSDLEELGYIIKPHTSAGRIPSDKGYRLYVNNLIKEKENEIKTIKTELNTRVDKLESMLKSVVKTIATNTNYAAMISGPSANNSKIKYVQLSNLEDKKVLVVSVAEGNIVKTNIVDVSKNIDANELIDMSMALNNMMSGISISEIDNTLSEKIESIKKNKSVIKTIVKSIINSYEKENTEDNIWTFGSNNFFKYKEFIENENVSNLVEAFEQKKELAKIVEKANSDNNETGLGIYIGEESSINSMKNCSVVTAKCDFGGGMKGTIGVVGPKRMDYEKVLKAIKSTMQNMNKELEQE